MPSVTSWDAWPTTAARCWVRCGKSMGIRPIKNWRLVRFSPSSQGWLSLGYGYIGLEEDVVITENGAEYFTKPQKEIVLIQG
jgi:hypothetical protein